MIQPLWKINIRLAATNLEVKDVHVNNLPSLSAHNVHVERTSCNENHYKIMIYKMLSEKYLLTNDYKYTGIDITHKLLDISNDNKNVPKNIVNRRRRH